MTIFSPLEQFVVVTFLSINLIIFDISVSYLISFFLLIFFLFFLLKLSFKLYIVPNSWQMFVEELYKNCTVFLKDNIIVLGIKSQKYFPFIFVLFSFIFFFNTLGLIPYSFVPTAQIIQTFFLSFTSFLGTFIICLFAHGFRLLAVFLPGGSPLLLAPLLVPIEIISFIFKPISLGVRLFVNIMAGHTLLKVLSGFAISLVGYGNFLFVVHFVPLIALILIHILEFFVSLIQAYVFVVLTCVYLNDSVQV